MMCLPKTRRLSPVGAAAPIGGKRARRSTADNINKWAKAYQQARMKEAQQQILEEKSALLLHETLKKKQEVKQQQHEEQQQQQQQHVEQQQQQHEEQQQQHVDQEMRVQQDIRPKSEMSVEPKSEPKSEPIEEDANLEQEAIAEDKMAKIGYFSEKTELKQEQMSEMSDVKMEYHEYGGSEDDEVDNEHFVNTSSLIKRQQRANNDKHVDVFIATLLHALRCNRGCNSLSCSKMRLVLSHFLSCPKLALRQPCQLCQQLNRLIAIHAHNCDVPDDKCCPVPLCDTMRPEINNRKNSLGNIPM